MRYLVLSDIHSNLEALDACLVEAREQGFDRTLVLGDVVGYGADPNSVIERVQALDPAGMVRGNHDKVACGLEQPEGFNSVAKSATRWTFDALTPDNRAWLAALPRGPRCVSHAIEICHGSPVDEDAYIVGDLNALRALKGSARPLCLFGHTHYPVAWVQSMDAVDSVAIVHEVLEPQPQIALRPNCKYLLNPGAVGQPRDGDPRAAFAIVDDESGCVGLFRVPYSIELAQAKIIAAGLPAVLAKRLAVGR